MPILNTLVSFKGTNGSGPIGGLIMDAAGDLFGVTRFGGPSDEGTVFEISRTTTGYASAATLASFNISNGFAPMGALIIDAAGNLFGTTEGGGPSQTGSGFGSGTVFEVSNTASGYATTPTILVSFNGIDGEGPMAGLITDAAGDLFGTTLGGGSGGFGTVFEIAKTAAGYAATPTTLASFGGTAGINPSGELIADSAGNLYGTTQSGLAGSFGTVFELALTASGYASTPTVLVTFNGPNGRNPRGGLIFDSAGNLYGTTAQGGSTAVSGGSFGSGTVFEIVKTASGYASSPSILANFGLSGGTLPGSTLIMDSGGDLFGTAQGGGDDGDGTVFEIVKTASGYVNTPVSLHDFTGNDSSEPNGRLLADSAGDLFGATLVNGPGGGGIVFELGAVVSSGAFVEIQPGGFILGATVFGTLQIDTGATASATRVSSGGVIDTFGSDAATFITSGGSATVEFGGVATFATVSNGALEVVSAGGVASGALLLGSGQVGVALGSALAGSALAGGARAGGAEVGGSAGILGIAGQQLVFGSASGTVVSGGSLQVSSGGTATAARIFSGGTADTFGFASATLINNGGAETVHSGGLASATTVSGGAVQTVGSGGTALGALLLGGGRQGIAGGAAADGAGGVDGVAGVLGIAGQQLVFGTASGTVIAGGMLVLENGGSLGAGAIRFAGTGGTFQVLGSTAPANVISGFGAADTIDLAAAAFNSSGSLTLQPGNQLVLSEGGQVYTLDFDPAQSFAGENFAFAADTGSGTKITLSGVTVGPGQSQTVGPGQIQHGIVVSGGVAIFFGTGNDTTVSSGQEFVESGGSASSTILFVGGDEFVEIGGTTSGSVIASGSQEVFGVAIGTVVSGADARVDLYAGGTTIGTVVSSGVELVIGVESGTVDTPGGFDFVYGSAVGTIVRGAVEYVELTAVANGTILSGGAQVVYGTANGAVLNSGGTAYFLSGSLASGIAVNSGLAVICQLGSTTTVASGSFDFVEPGGTAIGTVLNGGDEYVESGSVAIGTVIGSGAVQVDYGVAIGTVVSRGGFQYVYPGGTASGTVVASGGVQNVFVGTAFGTIDTSGGKDFIYSGLASGTIVGAGGGEFVEFGGTALDTVVSGAGATQDVVAGAAIAATLVSGGVQVVEAGEAASGTQVDSGGYQFVQGTAADTVISGGTVEITSNGAASGSVDFAASAGGLLKLDLSQRFGGTVAGFGLPDAIDFADIAFGSATILAFQEVANNQSGTLTISDGRHTANLVLLGTYIAAQFQLASDGGAGTLVTDPPPVPATSELVPSAIMAGRFD